PSGERNRSLHDALPIYGDTASAEETEGGAGDEDALVADIERGASPVEVSGQTYLFVGARYRFILVPQFIMGMFADGGTTVGVHSDRKSTRLNSSHVKIS